MTHLTPTGFLTIDTASLEYIWLAPQSADAPTIVMLHEGLGSVGLWNDFPEKLQQATGAGIFAYSRAGYGQSSKVALPRPRVWDELIEDETVTRLSAQVLQMVRSA